MKLPIITTVASTLALSFALFCAACRPDPKPVVPPPVAKASALTDETKEQAERFAHEAQAVAIRIRDRNGQIRAKERMLRQCVSAGMSLIEETRKMPPAEAARVLDDLKLKAVPLQKQLQDELDKLTITNHVDWTTFKSYFDLAGSSYRDPLPEVLECSCNNDYKVRPQQ